MTLAPLLLSAALCRGGVPLMPVVVGVKSAPRTLAAARGLADSLGRICGKGFRVETGDGSRGLALGTPEDFPLLGLAREFDAEEPMRREQYLLRSGENGLIAVGLTPAAVEDASADLLYRAGWRRFFPGSAWEIVPRSPDLALAVSVKTSPAFASRDMWYGFGLEKERAPAFREWARLNRLPGAFDLETGHAFEDIISRHKDEFKAHPEYLALSGGHRASTKLCLSNPAVRKLVVDDAAALFAADTRRESASLEPSDGDGWCECEACREMGSPSDRLLALGNEVSKRLELLGPGKYAAFYAYHRHAPPPLKVNARERVIVTVATAFLPKGHTPEEYLDGWRRRGVKLLGLREYWGVFQWNRSLPGRMRGGDLSYLATKLPRFHALGARFINAEAGEDWGAAGLGYYVASRLMWDLSEASRVDAIREDFLEKAFGRAREPMRAFYALVDGGRGLHDAEVPPKLVADMYARLSEARSAEVEPAVMARLDDLILYTRYVELYATYQSSLLSRQQAFAELVRHARRMKGRMMVHVRALLAYMPERDPLVSVPPDDGAPDYTPAEAAEILQHGLGASR